MVDGVHLRGPPSPWTRWPYLSGRKERSDINNNFIWVYYNNIIKPSCASLPVSLKFPVALKSQPIGVCPLLRGPPSAALGRGEKRINCASVALSFCGPQNSAKMS